MTSNPSPDYIARIAQVFIDNGSGIRGDLAAVVKAILLDDEARNGIQLFPTTFGKLKEPVLKVASVWRAFNATGVSAVDESGSEGSKVIRYYGSGRELAQRPYGAPSVFNFYRPEFSRTGDIRNANIVAPEFQILNENTITSVTNRFLFAAYDSDKDNPGLAQNFNYRSDTGRIQLDFTEEKALADNEEILLDRLNLLLLGGKMSAPMRTLLLEHLRQIPPVNQQLINVRVGEALYLITSSPEFSVQR